MTQNLTDDLDHNLVTNPPSKILQRLGDLNVVFGAIFGIKALLIRYR